MHRLLAALRRIMEQTKEPKHRMLMRRSIPRNKRKVKKKEDTSSSDKKNPLNLINVCVKRNDQLENSSEDD